MYLTERGYYERGPLVLIRKMRKLPRGDLRQGSASPRKCHTHFTGKTLWITYSWPRERVPWQPWQEGLSCCQLKPYHLGLAWVALLMTLSLPPTQGTLVGAIAIVYLPFCSWALAQTSCPHPPAQTCTWEVCSEKAQLWICQFLSMLLICLFCLKPHFFGDPPKSEVVLARWRLFSPFLAWKGASAGLQSE